MSEYPERKEDRGRRKQTLVRVKQQDQISFSIQEEDEERKKERKRRKETSVEPDLGTSDGRVSTQDKRRTEGGGNRPLDEG